MKQMERGATGVRAGAGEKSFSKMSGFETIGAKP